MTESGCHIFLGDSNKLSQDMCASSVLRHTIVKCWDIGELFVLWGVYTESVIDFSPIKFMNPKEKSRRSTFKARIGQILKRICGWVMRDDTEVTIEFNMVSFSVTNLSVKKLFLSTRKQPILEAFVLRKASFSIFQVSLCIWFWCRSNFSCYDGSTIINDFEWQ